MFSRRFQRLALAILFAAAAFFAAVMPSSADENTLNLPPAEYKGLPEGTIIKLLLDDNRASKYKVTGSEDYEITYKVRGRKWRKRYALFGRDWDNAYSHGTVSLWRADFDSNAKQALKAIWPLKVGSKTTIKFKERNDRSTYGHNTKWERSWIVTMVVVGTEYLRLNGSVYATYVIEQHAIGENAGNVSKTRYKQTIWYHPDSGIILKAYTEDPRGDSGYHVTSVTFPNGTTTHALTPTAVAVAAADPGASEELERKRQEVARLQAALEEQRKAFEAQVRRQRQVASGMTEAEMWAAVSAAPSTEAYQDYLAFYPLGTHASEAKTKLATMQKFALVEGVSFGRYHALVIGVDKYEHMTNLTTAVNDARAVAKVLENDYGFKVTLLENPEGGDIIDAFDELRETLTSADNLLIYYGGHGWLDEEADRGYWLAADAKPNRRRNWVAIPDVTDTMRTLMAKHVMVVADSCFSGTLVRAADAGFTDADYQSGDYWRRMASKQARVAITSGGLEPVADKGGSGHSPFARAFIGALRNNEAVLDGTALFNEIRRPVMVAADQTPRYSDVRNAGHDGGDFLFVRKQ